MKQELQRIKETLESEVRTVQVRVAAIENWGGSGSGGSGGGGKFVTKGGLVTYKDVEVKEFSGKEEEDWKKWKENLEMAVMVRNGRVKKQMDDVKNKEDEVNALYEDDETAELILIVMCSITVAS